MEKEIPQWLFPLRLDGGPETYDIFLKLSAFRKDMSPELAAERLGITRHNAYYHLKKLVDLGYAEKPKRGRYRIMRRK